MNHQDNNFQDFSLENRIHDQAPHLVCMASEARYKHPNYTASIILGPLTDKAIKKYEALGFYHPESIKARVVQRMRKPAPKNFRYGGDGRLIFCPGV